MREGFQDRAEAGRRLGEAVAGLFGAHPEMDAPLVLALPRGGAPVALEVARALRAPLDLVLVRKIGAPRNPELAAGAVVDGGHPRRVVNDEIVAATGMSDADLAEGERRALAEIDRRRELWLGDRPREAIAGRDAVVVDDGIATGATMRAALQATRAAGPRSLTLAVPVAPPETLDAMRPEVDRVICLLAPEHLGAVGAFYREFGQTDDSEVAAALAEADRFARG